ncbi:carboxypeptidase regulatory-like domain-containing protein, partial [bacterium]
MGSRFFAFLTVLVMLVAGMVPSVAAGQGDTGTIVGTVVDLASSLPVAGANVTLDHADSPVASTTTDASGSYHLDGIAPGPYAVVLQAAHYD